MGRMQDGQLCGDYWGPIAVIYDARGHSCLVRQLRHLVINTSGIFPRDAAR